MSAKKAVSQYIAGHHSVSVSELGTLGLSRPMLYRILTALLDQGKIVRVRRGVYQTAARRGASDNWVQVMQHYPQGVLCLLSALAFHELTTQSPPVIWLALPKSAWRKALVYPKLRLVHFSGEAWTSGIQAHKRSGGQVRVYSVAKTVADCFKFRTRVGLDVALEALREGWQQKRFTLPELAAMSRACRVQAVMRPYVEGLVA